MFTIREQAAKAFPPKQPSPPDLVHEQSSISTQAFSHNPADDSFAPLPDRTGANTKYLNERFLSY
ncbi:hypothetical protein DFJ43DRAFT_1135238 [Lentinula guzmanii]|uniref:Uncharacterized protein n=1 Tax=Lentinula guzmanii TaxID=2804957 RepID=A0AA38J535_9AGAR|nr:hypothetical protein DFJ43DRAFT_1135238 [Lentinula guzmanii]